MERLGTEEESRVDRMIEEEKNRVLDYDPKDRALYVKSQIDQIVAKKKRRMHMDDIKIEHFDFFDRYPKLFEKLFQPDVDMREIDYMVHMLGSIGSRGRTLHDASRAVGQQLADRYVTGAINKK